jgi:hemolysin activation/secretion protein
LDHSFRRIFPLALRRRSDFPAACALGLLLMLYLGPSALSPCSGDEASGAGSAVPAAATRYFIREYRVTGTRHLPRIDIESAVYPFLGPQRTDRDIEGARSALEKAYADAGFQTVAVSVPPQNISAGIIELHVLERTVGRLRVKGARYSSPQAIKALAPSVAEGRVINFNEVPADISALNQLPDRQVIPSLRAGARPDTVDVDLEVKEHAPLHASIEVNNRAGPNTKPLRVNASVSANNIAQSGQSAGLSFQDSPQAPSQVRVLSGYYLARFRGADWLNLMVQGTKQDSNVSTLGGTAVAGRGTTAGVQMLFNLPAIETYTQSASVGLDYKHFDQTIHLGATDNTPATTIVAPITYYPLTATYAGTWQDKDKRATTEFNAGVTFHVRGLGSDQAKFDNSRFHADGSFIYFRGDLAHTHEIGAGFQVFGKVQGQLANQQLLSGEQIAGGGLGTVRGYREAEQVGDSGLFGTLELRSPSLLKHVSGAKAEWRLFAFADAGWLKVIDELTGQKNHFDFASYGLGARWQLADYFNGAVLAARPTLKEGETNAEVVRVIFQGTLSY